MEHDLVPVDNCTGCSACRARCPERAIEMREDAEGFLYPFIDVSRCTLCRTCVEICPAHPFPAGETPQEPAVYAAWTRDRELLLKSSSGGAFSELARTVLERGGVVFGAAYDEHMAVRQTAVETWDDLGRLRGSKYVQSDAADSYDAARDYLDAGRAVLYSGTPCLVAGLYAALGGDHDRLLACSLICHGVPSPKVFRKHLDALAGRHGQKIRDFVFRDKRGGWRHPTIRIELDNRRTVCESNSDNTYSQGFATDLFLRTSCHQCPVKARGPVGDIVLGDFWQLSKHRPELVNPKGTSAIIAVTGKGLAAVEACRGRLELTECPFEYLAHDSMLSRCPKPRRDRPDFFADLDRLSFKELTKKYLKPRGLIVRSAAKVKRFLLALRNRMKG